MEPLPHPRSKAPATRKPFFSRRAGANSSAKHSAKAADVAVSELFAEELQRAKLDAMKELAYGASHEINNPLANIALRMQTLLKRETVPEKRKMLEAAHRSAMRAHEMISDLMLFARPPALQKSSVSIVEVLDQVVEEMHTAVEDRGAVLHRSPGGEDAVAHADPMQLAVVVKSLIDNAVEAIGRGGAPGAIAVSAYRMSHDRVALEVVDDGPGIEDSILPHVFDPFFSGREAGRGLGFGLSKCWRIVTDHGGEVWLANKSPSGLRATVTLPAASCDSEC